MSEYTSLVASNWQAHDLRLIYVDTTIRSTAMRLLFALICSTLMYASAVAQSNDDDSLEATFNTVRQFMEAERDVVLEDELSLSRREGNDFWPIYRTYRTELDAVYDRYAELISAFDDNYDSMSDRMARELIGDYFSVQSELIEVRQRYVPIFLSAISAQKLARFYQVENKIDTVAGLELTLATPLTEVSGRSRRN